MFLKPARSEPTEIPAISASQSRLWSGFQIHSMMQRDCKSRQTKVIIARRNL